MKFRTPFSKRVRFSSRPVGSSRTKQSFKNEVNVNSIVKRYRKTKDTSLLAVRDSFFADFSTSIDLATAYSAIDKAEFEFSKLSATTRDYFDNDPVRFFRELSDPERVKSLPESLGLLKAGRPKEPLVPVKEPLVPVVEPAHVPPVQVTE
jgi:hypothetical protein